MFHVLKNCSKILPKCVKRLKPPMHSYVSTGFHSKSIKEFYRQTFERLDLNRDGVITEEDLKWTLSTLGYGEGIIALMGYKNKDHLANCMMIELDKKEKGAVDLDSLIHFIEQRCPSEELIIQRFRDIDKNEDGLLSRDELRQSIIQQHDSIPEIVLDDLVDKQMNLYDKDKDGYIGLNEYISAWYFLDVVGALILRVTTTPGPT